MIPILKRICLLLCLFLSVDLFSQQEPVAVKGVLDLRGTEYCKDESIALKGEWAFVWNKYVDHNDFKSLIAKGDVHWVKVPNYWNAYSDQIPEIKEQGYATYHLTILVDKDLKLLSMFVPEIVSSYQLSSNGEEIQRNGTPGTTKETTLPSAESEFFDLKPDNGVIELTIRVANFHHRRAGIWNSIFIGPKEPLRNLAVAKIAWDIFILGWLLGFGIYHFGIFFQRIEDKANLYFGLYCLILSIRVLVDSLLPLEDWFNLSWFVYYKLSYLPIYIAPALLGNYLRALYPFEFSKRIIRIITYISIGLCLVVLFSPPIVFTKTFPAFIVFTIILFFYGLVILSQCVIRKRDSAHVFLLVFTFLFIAATNDMLYTSTVIRTGFIFHISLAVFVVVQSGVISSRFTKALTLSEELTHRMESKIAERTKELNSAKEHAQALAAKAEEANNAKSTFLATMSHEIRTPMNGIIGMASVMGHTQLDDRQKGYLQTIKSSGETLLNLINGILDFSKIEAGKIELEDIPFSLKNITDDCLYLVLPKVHEKGIHLNCHYAHNIPDVLIGDPTRIKQILSNLLSNAVKFTESGTIHANIGIKLSTDNSVIIRFSVADSGIGITKEQKIKLFQTFTQLDDSTTRKYGGTGLGLAICKRLVHLMKGRIWVDSTPNVGSTFFCEIPLRKLLGSKNDIPINTMQNGKVAILTQDELLWDCIREDFAYFGYLSEHCHTTEEVSQLLKRENINLTIIDSSLSETDDNNVMSLYTPLLYLHCEGRKPDDTENVWHSYIPIKREYLAGVLKKSQTESTKDKDLENLIPTDDPISQFSKQYPLKILVAEDDVNNQKVARLMLGTLGYEKEIVENGKEVIEALSKKHYDLLFLDIQMPEMDGYETTEAIIKNWLPAERPYIIAVTAFALRGDRKKALEAGMDDYLSKPITLDPVCEKIKIAYKKIQEKKKKA
jgi:signal transduction histidine kinase/CheY-like chemotaxis protein